MREIIVKKTLYKYHELPNSDAKRKAKLEYIYYQRSNKEFETIATDSLKEYGFEEINLCYDIKLSLSDYIYFSAIIPIDKLFEDSEFDLGITKDDNFKYNALDTFESIEFKRYDNKLCIGVIGDNSWCNCDDYMKFVDACERFYNTISDHLEKDAYSYFSEVSDDEIIDAEYEYEEDGTWYHDIIY
ncbi:MAG: hypothetical protein HDQ88_04840 [Clostridia bacterium]|nr:hypothetical protein [Clostridia bacterium]